MTAEELEENIREFIDRYHESCSASGEIEDMDVVLWEAVGWLDSALEYIELGNHPL